MRSTTPALPHGPYDIYVGGHGDLNGWGGAIVASRGLASACKRDGLRTALFGFDKQPESQDMTPDGISQRNVIVSPLPLLWRLHSWYTPRILARYLRKLQRPRLAFVSFSPFWAVAAKRVWPDLPLLFRFCGLLTNCVPFTRSNHQKRPFWARVGIRNTCAIEKRALRLTDRMLVPSLHHARELVALEPRVDEHMRVCPEGCRWYDTSPEMRQRQRAVLNLRDHDFLIAVIGGCDQRKRFDHAIREMRQIDRRGHLVVIGDGPDRSDLETLAEELAIASRVHFVGWQREMAAWYAASDCVVSTSVYDPFPNVIREGMWCGHPAIVPEHDPPRVFAGLAIVIGREGGGLLYDRLIDGELSNRVNQLINDRALTRRLGEEAHEIAARLFGWDDTVMQIHCVAERR